MEYVDSMLSKDHAKPLNQEGFTNALISLSQVHAYGVYSDLDSSK